MTGVIYAVECVGHNAVKVGYAHSAVGRSARGKLLLREQIAA
jgi:hypothetical protein